MAHRKLCVGQPDFSSKKNVFNFENLNMHSYSHVHNWATFSLKSLK